MSYLSNLNGRGKFADRPRRSLYDQWGMEARRLVSTGKYRGDTGAIADYYIIAPRSRSKLLEVGMTVGDLVACIALVAFIGITAYAIGPGMDACIAAMGW